MSLWMWKLSLRMTRDGGRRILRGSSLASCRKNAFRPWAYPAYFKDRMVTRRPALHRAPDCPKRTQGVDKANGRYFCSQQMDSSSVASRGCQSLVENSNHDFQVGNWRGNDFSEPTAAYDTFHSKFYTSQRSVTAITNSPEDGNLRFISSVTP